MEFDVVLMFTGMILVFLILVLLEFIIMAEGKFFDSRDQRRKNKADAELSETKQPTHRQTSLAKKAAAPSVEQGIPAEIVAVIVAAISAISGGKYTLRAVRRAKSDAWSRAGVSDVTSPF